VPFSRRALLRACVRFRPSALAAAGALPLAAQAEEVLRVSAIPDEAPTELQRKFAPLGAYLEAETGMKVSFVPVTDYAAVVEALATRKIDMAWLGGFTFVQARIRTKGTAVPLVQRAEDAKFTSQASSPPATASRASPT
jgi:phosphonate transport system substrate-binding protein